MMSAGGRAAREIRRHLAAFNPDDDSGVFARADALLDRLGTLPPAAEDEVGRILGRPWRSPDDLFSALEAAIGPAESSQETLRWTLTGVIISD
jgi:hypothetical protein